jgi:predicted AAA+ superfamily ATPase
MLKRALESAVGAALSDTPVVMLVGARQSGKSTLAQASVENREATYSTFDEPRFLAAARADPVDFIAGLGDTAILDEVQRVPEIFLPIKASVDRDRRPGRFLLTGSANPLFVPEIAEALAGRIEILTLWPFSQAELEEADGPTVVEMLFGSERPKLRWPVERGELADRMVRGGFPEAVEREDESRREQWFSSYVTTILEREVRAVADISRLEEMPALLIALALRSRGHSNKSALSQDLGIPVSTIDRYLVMLERVYMVRRLQGWHSRLGPRLVKSPKLLLCDTGLLCNLLRWDRERLLSDPISFGLALESFVGIEIAKAADLHPRIPRLMHYRTSKGVEIDFILEAVDGRVAAVEVKASSTLGAADFRRFDRLREILAERFVRGVVFYTGDRVLPFGDRLEAWPVSTLWGSNDH